MISSISQQTLPVLVDSRDDARRCQRDTFFTPSLLLAKAVITSNVHYCYNKVVITVVHLGCLVKETIAKVHALFVNTYASFCESRALHSVVAKCFSLVVFDKQSEQKIELARTKLSSALNSDYYIETAKFFGQYVGAFLKSAFEQGRVMPVHLRADWLADLLWQKPDGSWVYTFKGQVLSELVLKNTELFSRYIELVLLQGFSHFADRIQSKQAEGKYTLVPLVKDLLANVSMHFDACHQAAKLNQPVVHIASQTEEEIIQDVSNTLLLVFLPDGLSQVDLPVPEYISGYVGSFILSMIKTQVLPKLVSLGLEKAKNPLIKTFLLNEGLTLEKANIEREYYPRVPEHTRENIPTIQKELEELLFTFLTTAINYVMPDTKSLFTGERAIRKLGETGSEALLGVLSNMCLQDIVGMVLEQTAPALNSGGVWIVEGRQRRFRASAFQFEHSEEVKQYNDQQALQKFQAEQERLRELVQTTGDDPKRLYQIFQSTLFYSNKPVYSHPEEQSQSLLGKIVSKTVTVYGGVANMLVKAVVHRMSIKEFIKALNHKIPPKLLLPEHDRLFLIFTKSIIKLLK